MNRYISFIASAALLFPLAFHTQTLTKSDMRGLYARPFRTEDTRNGYLRDGNLVNHDVMRRLITAQRKFNDVARAARGTR